MKNIPLVTAAILMMVLGLLSCHSTNQPDSWVLEYLKNNKMELRKEKSFLDSDSKPFEICGSEWNQFGSFCYSNLTTVYQTEDRAVMAGLISKVSNSLFKVAQFVEKLLDVIDKLKKEKNLPNNNVLDKVEKNLQGEPTTRLVQFLKQFVARHGQSNLIGAANTCWAKMMAMREQAVCFICSGRNQQFEAGSKLVISAKTCSSVVESCKGDFALLAGIADGSKELFTKLRGSLKEGGFLEIKFGGKIDSTIKLLATIDSPTLLRLLKELSEASSPTLVAKAEAELCQKTIAIVKKPFLQFLTPIFRHVEKNLEDLQNDAQEQRLQMKNRVTVHSGDMSRNKPQQFERPIQPVFQQTTPSPSVTAPPTRPLLQKIQSSFFVQSRSRKLAQTSTKTQSPQPPAGPTPPNYFNPFMPPSFIGDIAVQTFNTITGHSNTVISPDAPGAGKPIPMKLD